MSQYELDELALTKTHVDKCLQDDPDTLILQGCILCKEGKFQDAVKKFQEAMNISGYSAHTAYNIALCYYYMKSYPTALKYMQEIVERGIKDHPELSVGSNMEMFDVRSVGNSQTLRDTALVEAFNLKMAIEYMLRNCMSICIQYIYIIDETASDALKDMPPRLESELDAVTLHNQALLQMEKEPTGGFKKLKYLLQAPPFPPETFANLLLLYCKYSYYYLAADILAENGHLTFKYLTQELYDFLAATIESQTSPEEAFRKFDELATKHTDQLRKLIKLIQDARKSKNESAVRVAAKDYDEALEAYEVL